MKKYIALFIFTLIIDLTSQANEFNDLKIYTENNPPYVLVNEKNEISGLVGEKVVKALKKLKIENEVKIEVVPWARALIEAKKQKNVMIFPFVKTKERLGIFNFAILAYKQTLNFYKLRDAKGIEVHNLEDAKKYTTCVVRNDYRHEHLLQANFSKIEETAQQTQNVQKFLNKRCELIIIAEEGLKAKLKELYSNMSIVEKVLEVPEFDGNIYIAFSPGSDSFIINKFKEVTEK
ncbi:transporter substrate-binding domain-containing protein [Pigmentibacter sp. JX0631]|uniref:substrate-binding periplasmic protein n=1 Tax=Pigmentibacter sp. JX0631 TaxID=2976982 RepID=UPI0024697CDC|nr:transporter substrate-binding domain-containing protein [Pigmentibacter sp. JX0631]WGL59873.1 transporter substrate-binding domain-containing protein [Pigmentibacter sp. JX0631]